MTSSGDNERLDSLLVRLGWAPSRRVARELIAGGRVRVNGRRLRKGDSVTRGDHVEVTGAADPVSIVAQAEPQLEVLFEDSSLIVVNKPGLLPCHPLRPGETDTVINAVAAIYPETAKVGDKPLEGGLVHRLDNGTSGALLIARTQESFATLRAAIRAGSIVRRYKAVLCGRLDVPTEITAPIAHHPKNPRKMVTVRLNNDAANGHNASSRASIAAARPAATVVVPQSTQGAFTRASVLPRTGRRHQIRVHLASIGLPLAGDGLYGGISLAVLAPGRFWLHLSELHFDSPASGRVKVQAPLAADLDAALALIRKSDPAQMQRAP